MGDAAAECQTIAIEIGRQAADGIPAPPQERFENCYDRIAIGDEPTCEREDQRGHEARTGNRCKQTDEKRAAKGIAELASATPSSLPSRYSIPGTSVQLAATVAIQYRGLARAVGSASQPRSISLRDFAAAAQPSGDQVAAIARATPLISSRELW